MFSQVIWLRAAGKSNQMIEQKKAPQDFMCEIKESKMHCSNTAVLHKEQLTLAKSSEKHLSLLLADAVEVSIYIMHDVKAACHNSALATNKSHSLASLQQTLRIPDALWTDSHDCSSVLN